MAKILFAWELGRNFGHVARDWPLAQAMLSRGHEVTLALADLSVAHALQLPAQVRCVQSPMLDRLEQALSCGDQERKQIRHYADVLLSQGWEQQAQLAGLLRGWLALFELTSAQVMVYDFAPTALLAARIAQLPCLLLGNSFEIPRHGQPLVDFLAWAQAAHPAGGWRAVMQPRVDDGMEARALTAANLQLQLHGAPPLAQLADLFAKHSIVMPTLPELDHFGARNDVVYCGPCQIDDLKEATTLLTATWPAYAQQRVLVYLRANTPHVEVLLGALAALHAQQGIAVLCLMPDVTPHLRERFSGLMFETRYVDLAAHLPGVDLLITHGPITAMLALLRGVPVLLTPQVMEQYLAGLAMLNTNATALLKRPERVDVCAKNIQRCLNSQAMREAALAFAKRHAHVTSSRSLAIQVQALEKLLP